MKTHLPRSMRLREFTCGLLLVVASCSAPRDRDSAKSTATEDLSRGVPSRATTNDASAAARAFVQEFYAWYAPIARKDSHVAAWYTVLDQRPLVLSDTLLRALQRDREEQSKAVGEIAGLDFDPFLAAQDPCERYVTGDSVQAGQTYRVSIFGVCGKTRHARADLIAEVARRGGSWVFIDFHYPGPDGGHLLEILSTSGRSSTSK